MQNRTDEFRRLLAGKVDIRSQIEDLRASYKNAKPFPHVVIDELFGAGLLDALLCEMGGMFEEQWVTIGHDTRERTARMRSAAEMSEAGNQLMSIVHSAAFLYLLSEITEITQLLPDPYLQGAGYARMKRGDYFSVHADRNVAYETGLTRRLAMIVFLNKSWCTDYHGQLELWSADAKRCEVSIPPHFNKTVIFEVAYPNFHGVPAPLACPDDRTRQSFIVYFHTAGASIPGGIKPHSSIFAPRFYGSNRMTFRALVRDLTPPLLSRAIRRLGKRV